MADILNAAGAARGDETVTLFAGTGLPETADENPSEIEMLMVAYEKINAAQLASQEPFNATEAVYFAMRPTMPLNPSPKVMAAWEKECARISRETGFDATELEQKRLSDMVSAVARKIAATPARSQRDLKIKLELARDWTGGCFGNGADGVDVALGLSLVNDLLGADSTD